MPLLLFVTDRHMQGSNDLKSLLLEFFFLLINMKARKWHSLFKVCALEGFVFLFIVLGNVWYYSSQFALAFTQTTKYLLMEKGIICFRNFVLELHSVHVVCSISGHASHLLWIPAAACVGGAHDGQVIRGQMSKKPGTHSLERVT